MVWIFAVVGALLVFAVAAAFVGSAAFRLGHEPPPTVFDLDEAVDHVADGLDEDVASRLTYDELRALITFVLDHLRSKGLSARPGEELAVDPHAAVVVADDDEVAVVLGRAEDAGLQVVDQDVVVVIDGLLDYLASIGAIGPRAG